MFLPVQLKLDDLEDRLSSSVHYFHADSVLPCTVYTAIIIIIIIHCNLTVYYIVSVQMMF